MERLVSVFEALDLVEVGWDLSACHRLNREEWTEMSSVIRKLITKDDWEMVDEILRYWIPQLPDSRPRAVLDNLLSKLPINVISRESRAGRML